VDAAGIDALLVVEERDSPSTEREAVRKLAGIGNVLAELGDEE
jgi:hypothetical protein